MKCSYPMAENCYGRCDLNNNVNKRKRMCSCTVYRLQTLENPISNPMKWATSAWIWNIWKMEKKNVWFDIVLECLKNQLFSIDWLGNFPFFLFISFCSQSTGIYPKWCHRCNERNGILLTMLFKHEIRLFHFGMDYISDSIHHLLDKNIFWYIRNPNCVVPKSGQHNKHSWLIPNYTIMIKYPTTVHLWVIRTHFPLNRSIMLAFDVKPLPSNTKARIIISGMVEFAKCRL